ncbi:MAG: hypothetical protein ABF370_10140 [Verrucomicrobiales bacterium]|nr:hypothetical protein [Verrucomicrobiaceae bacterium]
MPFPTIEWLVLTLRQGFLSNYGRGSSDDHICFRICTHHNVISLSTGSRENLRHLSIHPSKHFIRFRLGTRTYLGSFYVCLRQKLLSF